MNYTPEVSSNAYIMSICCIVNEKFRENVPAWEVKKKLIKKSRNLLKFSLIIIKCCLYLIVFAAANAGALRFTFSVVCCVSGLQEGTKSFSIFLQMCDGSRSGR